ncbi:MAG TPA: right-handed parallel beta-helix repeat-containing protein [Anaerolineae bacterium]|nr:right-handed parallel beta-helix repeat-containing protein [Anaerolineae bacterium]
MPSADVSFPLPLTRFNTLFPGQVGVPGGWTETGLRLHCTGAIFYVDPNHSDANDNRDGTDPTSPLATVATALTKCQAFRGDVIAVMANNFWQYGNAADGYALPVTESVIVTVPGVRIVGVSPSGAMGVYWRPAAVDGTCITVRAVDVLVEGFAFLGRTGGTGVLGQWAAGTTYGDNLVVRHCYFDENLDEGIVLTFVWYADIHDNYFDNCNAYGIAGAGAGDPGYNRIHHNWFQDCGTSAIWLPGADRNHIYENYVYQVNAASGDAGTLANCLINLTGGSRNMVHHNTLSCVLPGAVAWDYNATNTAGAGDAWASNWLMDGPSITNPT